MKLVELHPKWLDLSTGERCGVSFACPVHAKNGLDENGSANCLLGRVYIRTEPVAGAPGVGPRWHRTGDDFATMTLSPSLLCRTVPEGHARGINEAHECNFQRCTIVHWHGFVTGGEVSILPDSQP